MELRGAYVFVSGGARRLGREICLTLARAGAHVSFSFHHSQKAAADTLRELQELGSASRAMRCDISSLADVQEVRIALSTMTHRLDLLVNSASPFVREAIPLGQYKTWRHVTRASTDGCLYLCQECLPLLQAASDPTVLNLLDLTIRRPLPGFTAHAVAKSGMEALTRQLALELAPRIRVNGIVAGPVLPPDEMSRTARQRIARRTLLGRWGTPADITRAVKFVARSPYMTGALLHVDGGESIGPAA